MKFEIARGRWIRLLSRLYDCQALVIVGSLRAFDQHSGISSVIKTGDNKIANATESVFEQSIGNINEYWYIFRLLNCSSVNLKLR